MLRNTWNNWFNPFTLPGETARINWARPSASNSYPLFSTVGSINELEPYEFDTVAAPAGDSAATVWGYFYQMKDSLTDTIIGWMPQDTGVTLLGHQEYPIMGFTVYVSSDSMLPTAIRTMQNDFSLKVYPNPAQNQFHLSLETSDPDFYTIQLFNSLDQPVKTLFTGFTNNISSDNDIREYEAGIYYIRVTSESQLRVIKLAISK